VGSDGTSGTGWWKRWSIHSASSKAMRAAPRAVSRCPAVSLLSARKLIASTGISSMSPAVRNPTGTSSETASRRNVSGPGSCRPFS
jgi:hypothetical protein